VLEVKPGDATKALGVDTLMTEAPFLGSMPIAFGDDVTDLDMFEAIRRHEGTSVAVGPRIAGSGDLQLDAPDESLALLRELRDALEAGADSLRIVEVLRARTHA
jgi:trehalose 6-phosphate phosphatase